MITTKQLDQLADTHDFDTFYSAHKGDLTAIALNTIRRWGRRPSPSFGPDDLIQEMLIWLTLNVHKRLRPSHVVWNMQMVARNSLRHEGFLTKCDLLSEAPENPEITQQEALHLANELLEQVPGNECERLIMNSLFDTMSLDKTTIELLSLESTKKMFAKRARKQKDPFKAARTTVYNTAVKLAKLAEEAA